MKKLPVITANRDQNVEDSTYSIQVEIVVHRKIVVSPNITRSRSVVETAAHPIIRHPNAGTSHSQGAPCVLCIPLDRNKEANYAERFHQTGCTRPQYCK